MTITRSNRPIRILLAPSGFKEGLGVAEVIDCMARGVLAALPQAEILSAPMVDGGEGFTETLVALTRGRLHRVTVTGPVGLPVEAHFGFLGGGGRRIAVLEMASAAGLRLVPAGVRDPLRTTSRGVGELIRAALDAGAQRILVGCGDSGINDGGAGMAQALGIRLLDGDGAEIGAGGGALAGLRRIDLAGRDPRLDRVRIDVALNWHNQLLGPRGVSRVFGPQKGATPAAVAALEQALETYAAVVRRDLGIELRDMPGSGASGGLGAGLHALLGARLHPRYDIVMRYIDIDALLRRADLVLTAEGSLDGQTPFGKVPSEIGRRAKRYGLPVIALAGTVGPGAHLNLATGIDAYFSILTRPCSLAEALAEAPRLVADAAEQALRMVLAMAGTGASRRGRYGAAHGAVQAHHRV